MKLRAVAFAATYLFATTAQAQLPTISPYLTRSTIRDSTISVWLLVRPEQQLSDVELLVRDLGGKLRHRSLWLHAISAELDRSGIEQLRSSRLLHHIQPVARFAGPTRPADTPFSAPARTAAESADDSAFGPSAMPFGRLNIMPIFTKGVRGAGVRIAILDTGFETGHPAFDNVSVVAERDFVFGDATVSNEAEDVQHASRHGTEVWSLLAAGIPNMMIGIAPEAEYLLAKTEDVRSETRVEEDNYIAALEWADSIGVDVITSSLSYRQFDDGFSYSYDELDGDVALTTVAADAAAERGIVVLTAVGNDGALGFRTLTTPGDGDSVIAVGAEDSLGVLSGFSSKGPTADGRLKPDLTAPGQSVFVIDPTSPTGFARANGTSFATPIIAGTVALIRELHPLLQPMDILAALKRSASNRDAPDSSSGWGRPDATVAATFAEGIQVVSPADSILNTVTPLFSWQIPGVPAFALPMTYRLRVAEDTMFADILLDTIVTDSEVQFEVPLAGGQIFVFDLTATSADSASITHSSDGSHVVPDWVTLRTLNEAAGMTIRDRRPSFEWNSPEVATPPGPFKYDIAVLRIDNGVAVVEETEITGAAFVPSRDLDLNTPYRWRLVARLGSDSVVAESHGSFVIVDESLPTATLLFQNFPNPFPNRTMGVGSTCIWFDLSEYQAVTLDVLDIRGHIVKNLVPASVFPSRLPPGRYGRGNLGDTGRCDPRLEWDGTSSDGTLMPRGIYPMRLKTEKGTFFKRIVFLGGVH